MIAEPAIKADPVQEAQYDALESRILEAIRSRETAGEASFDALALAVYRFQVEWNAPYANYGRAVLGGAPVERWQDIPAVPQQAFKRSALRTFPEAETARTFRTSGTTGEGYGSHHFRSLRLYEASILAGWRHFELPAGRPQAVFTPRPETNPHSSLGHMMGVLGELAPPRRTAVFHPRGRQPGRGRVPGHGGAMHRQRAADTAARHGAGVSAPLRGAGAAWPARRPARRERDDGNRRLQGHGPDAGEGGALRAVHPLARACPRKPSSTNTA